MLLTVTKQPNTSTIDLTKHLDLALSDLKQTLPADVHISTDIFRQSDFIESSIDNVQKSLIEGAIFVVIILMIFLANVRTTVISLVTIPISFLVAMIVLNALGISINTMTLGGLAIAIGSLVDDAIVDVENVYKHIRQNRALPEAERVPIIELVFNASREVRMPILNSTLIIVVSFAPLFFLSGMEGRMLIPLGIAFVTALFASTLVALTLTPVLCSYLLGKSKGEMPKEAFVAVWLKKYYERALLWVLANTRKVIVGTAALFVVAVGVFFCLGSSFLPKFNEGSFTINISSLPGISLEESDSIGARAERLLLQVPEIKTVARKTGRAELDEHALGVNVSEIEAPFELKDRSHEEVLNDVRKRLSVLACDPVMPPEQPVRLPPDPCIEKRTLACGGQPGNAHLRARKRPERAFFRGNFLADAKRGMVHRGDRLKPAGERVGTHAAEAVRLLRRENDLFTVYAFRQS